MKHKPNMNYRLTPGISGLKRTWIIESCPANLERAPVWSTLCWVGSIKAAKAIVAHMRREPIIL